MTQAGVQSPDPHWVRAHCVHSSVGSRGRLRVLDFGSSAPLSEGDWDQVEAAESRELGARRSAIAAAQASQYRKVDVPCATLSNGHRLPLVGLGTWKAERGQVRSAVHTALKAGYRHIDCASVYQNEEEVGEALHHVTSRGLVPRQDLFICSKLWCGDGAEGGGGSWGLGLWVWCREGREEESGA